MPNLLAIHSVGFSVKTYLETAYELEKDELKLPQCGFDLLSSGELKDQGPPEPVLTLYLYRISINQHLRNARRMGEPSGSPAPLSLDLHYLLTVWAGNALTEHTMFAWAMDHLHRAPVLDVSSLSDEASWQAGDFIQLVPSELTNEDIMRIWDALAPPYHLSFPYTARVVRIDRETTERRRVVTSRFSLADEVPRPVEETAP